MQKEIDRSDQRADFERLSIEIIKKPPEDKTLEQEIKEDEVFDQMFEPKQG
jgi:hypothetical protein